jgi:serine/threonine protein kinase
MTPLDGERMYRLFQAANDMAPEERQEYLQRECGDDSALLEKLRGMLEFAGESGGLLGRAAQPQPAPDPGRVFEPGNLVSGRYRITRFVNRGGMGEVYLAYDTELDVQVALKTVRPELAMHEAMLSRFKREVQLEREVVHENVCPLYDFARHVKESGDVVHYVTMKYLAGQTLSEYLKSAGPIETAEAVSIAAQIAAALRASHAAGILHRDLKSANVMLVQGADGWQAVVTDFGLARRIRPDEAATISRAGQIMGTLDYMAPELLAGKSASEASDVYALGIILFEMVTGRRPYADAEPHVAAYRRSRGAPSAGDATGVPAALHRLIARCLDPDPARRPSVPDIATELRGPDRRPIAWLPRLPKSRLAAAAAILALAASLLVAFLRITRQSISVRPGSLIYLMEVDNTTGDSQLDAVDDLLRNHLTQSSQVRLADESKVRRARSLIAQGSRDPAAAAREVGLRVGAMLVVFATLARVGDGYDLAVRIDRLGADPSTVRGSVMHTWQVGVKNGLFTAVRTAGDFIRTAAGEPASDVARQDIPPEEAASSSWEALELYRQSEILRHQKETNRAIAVLERAIQIDPDFAMAHIHLADLLNGGRRQEEAFAHYRRALDAAGKRRLTRWEELMLRGNYALDTGDFPLAEAAFAELRRLYPRSYMPPHYLAAAVREEGRLEEAMTLERDAAALDPSLPQPVLAVVELWIRLGRWTQAAHDLARLRTLSPDLAVRDEGVVHWLENDPAAARSRFESLTRSTDSLQKSRGYSLLAQSYAESGEYLRAEALYTDGIAADIAAGQTVEAAFKHVALAWLELLAGNPVAARNDSLEAVRLVRTVELYRRAATILARAAYTVDAQRIIDDLGPAWPGPLAEATRRQILGEILLRSGKPAAGLHDLELADRVDSSLHLREYLAHGYEQAGDGERALYLYRSMTESRGPFWAYPDSELPGVRAGMLLEAAALARRLGHEAQAQSALREYQQIRSAADPNLPETVRARQLAAGMQDSTFTRKEENR